MAKQLLKGNNPGILSTVDQSGFPQSRWMATMSFDDFPYFLHFDLRHKSKLLKSRSIRPSIGCFPIKT